MHPYWSEFLALALIHFLAVLSPGPDFAVTVRQSIRFGRKNGIYTAIGIGCGISVHVVYTLIGMSALMNTTPWLMEVAKLIGGGYIIWLGIRFIQSRPDQTTLKEVDSNARETQSKKRAFLIGFMTNATNPKATLFFLAIFTTIVSRQTPLKIQMLYGIWMCSVNAIWFILVSLLFSTVKVRRVFVAKRHWFERSMGIILIALAVRLLLTTR